MFEYEQVFTEFGSVIKLTDESGQISWIPTVESNSDYQRYLRWLENPNADEFQPPLEG